MKKVKSIAYTYSFNYSGNKQFQGKNIGGASVDVLLKVYKDGELIEINEETYCEDENPDIKDICISEVIDVSFNNQKLFVVKIEPIVYEMFRIFNKYEKIQFEVVGYSLEYWISEFMQDTLEVSEKDFREFLESDKRGFDISDNKHAQSLAYQIIEIEG